MLKIHDGAFRIEVPRRPILSMNEAVGAVADFLRRVVLVGWSAGMDGRAATLAGKDFKPLRDRGAGGCGCLEVLLQTHAGVPLPEFSVVGVR